MLAPVCVCGGLTLSPAPRPTPDLCSLSVCVVVRAFSHMRAVAMAYGLPSVRIALTHSFLLTTAAHSATAGSPATLLGQSRLRV